MSDDLKERLLACPFCGGKTIGHHYIRDGRAVACKDCHASVRAFYPNAQEMAFKAWNTRADATRMGRHAEAMSENIELKNELMMFHDCADGDVGAGNGHFKLMCISDAGQQRLNLRSVLRNAAACIEQLEAQLAEAEKEDDRLRAVCHQMGDRHAAQVVQIKAMSEALEPFANAWRAYGDKPSDDARLSDNRGAAWLEGTLITFGNLRRASAALDPKPTATGETP